MEVNGIEKEVLIEITKRLVMSKEEIFNFFGDRVDSNTLENLLKNLVEKGYIASISPLGSSYVVTVKGMKEIKNEEKQFKESVH
ncbi:MAG: hypothetical protein QXG39_09045 [Candidatus Aenigmatarchaeota archaeon]